MTEDLGNRLREHFGDRGMRRLPSAALPGSARALPEAALVALDAGLPAQVGPYFSAIGNESPALGDHATSIGVPDIDPEWVSWCRIGTDQGAEICVDPSGAVQALFIVADVPALYVNATVSAFLECLLALDEALPVLRSPGRRDPAAVFRDLRSRLLRIDPGALQDDEDWWPRVLEVIRHALSFPAAVAFEFEAPDGTKHVETGETQVGVQHPEHLVWERLSGRGVRPEDVTRVYTELEPCFMPGNYCGMWLNRFPNAEFTYSYDYGATSEERETGILELMRHAASG